MAQEAPTPIILGISGGDHDAAAALFRGGELVAALEEEKLARVRRALGLPARAPGLRRVAGGGRRRAGSVGVARDISRWSV